MSSVSSPYTPLKVPMGPKAPPLADDDSHSEASIYITFHADKKYSHPPNHPHSLNAMMASFLANESKVPEVLYVDDRMENSVIAGRMVELLAQARPESRRPDIKRFPHSEDSDDEATNRGEPNPEMARTRYQLRQLTTRYRSTMVILQREYTTELADMRGWNIGEGLYEWIRVLQDHEISEMKVNGMPTISEDYGPDMLVKY